jgi:hypothetical protein
LSADAACGIFLLHREKGDSVKARLCLLLVILGLAGGAAPTALASTEDLIGGEGITFGYHDGDEAYTPADQ